MSENAAFLMFYTADCEHCEAMLPVINELLQENDIEFELVEVTPDDKATIARYDSYEQGNCGGVPFFVHTETKRWLCGEVSKDELRTWALAQQ